MVCRPKCKVEGGACKKVVKTPCKKFPYKLSLCQKDYNGQENTLAHTSSFYANFGLFLQLSPSNNFIAGNFPTFMKNEKILLVSYLASLFPQRGQNHFIIFLPN